MVTVNKKQVDEYAEIEVVVNSEPDSALTIWLARNAFEKPEYHLKVVTHSFEEWDDRWETQGKCQFSPTGYCHSDERDYTHGMFYAIKWMGWGDVLCNIIADEMGYFVSHEERVELFNA